MNDAAEAERVASLKERAWRETAAIDRRLTAGEIDEAGWHRAMAELIAPAYLGADNPYRQAGHSGDAASWEASRGFIADAIDRGGSFLDGGCASGVLMESVQRWGKDRGFVIEPYGVDIVPAFAMLARRRLPAWAQRIEVGNLRTWRPRGERFDFVLVRPEYAPPGRRAELFRHVLDAVVAPHGRLLVLAGSEAVNVRTAEAEALAGGLEVHGRTECPHPLHTGLCRRLFWIDGHRRDTS